MLKRCTFSWSLVLLSGTCYSQAVNPSIAPYKASGQMTGTVRVYGSALSGLVQLWEDGFAKAQPGVSFTNKFAGSDAAISGLDTGDYDIAPNGA